MIGAISGPPGAGKTAFLTSLGAKFLAQKIDIYPNYTLNVTDQLIEYASRIQYKNRHKTPGVIIKPELGNVRPWYSLNEFVKIQKGRILADEIPEYLERTDWEKLHPTVRSKLRQHRHDGLDIWGTCQDYKQVVIDVKRLFQRFLYVDRFWSRVLWVREYKYVFNADTNTMKSGWPKRFWVEVLPVKPLDGFTKIGFIEMLRIGRFVHTLYDTNEIIRRPSDAPTRRGLPPTLLSPANA